MGEGQAKDREIHEFKQHEVYGVDVLLSTGDGKNQEKDAKTTVFKKTGLTYMLKMKTSREFFSQVGKSYGPMPLSASEDMFSQLTTSQSKKKLLDYHTIVTKKRRLKEESR